MKKTRAELEQSERKATEEASTTLCALHDILNGDVKWFRSGTYSLGITRAAGACGGIAVLRFGGSTVGAYYFEAFAKRELEHVALVITGEDTAHNRELLARRKAIEAAKVYVSERQRADLAA